MTQVSPPPSTCWWCGSPADSREHRSKRTDLVNLFGAGPWQGSVARGVDGQLRKPQSANSREFKFATTLCSNCNNNRSQPFDRAYEGFIAYYDSHESAIEATRSVDLAAVFGSAWKDQQVDLSKYLVKHIGCRLADGGSPVPGSFVSYLDGGSPWPTELTVVMVFRSDTWELHKHLMEAHHQEARGVFIGPMDAMVSRHTGEVTELDSHYLYASLGIHWRIDISDTGGTNFAGPTVNLPEFYSVPPVEVAARCQTCNPESAQGTSASGAT